MSEFALIDGSRLIAESLVRAGADAYVGYPITPASLVYGYASRRFPVLLPAPDEITALQWMAGLSAAGHRPVSATSFPGLALMVESINMAYMMELPMVIVLVQRMGPSTGTATGGAQGDLQLLNGIISGGYPLPVFCIASMEDCWQLPPVALRTAVELRTPVVLLTSKEMVMTERSFDLAQLAEIEPLPGHAVHPADESYRPYAAESDQAPPFLPVGNGQHQVRLTASTHDTQGLLRHSTDEALANTRRLWAKVEANTPVLYDLDEQEETQTLVMTYGITAGAAREAVDALRREGQAVSLLIARTLLPLPEVYYEILDRYRIVVAEENLKGQLAALLYGRRLPEHVRVVSRIGHMVEPEEIIQAVREVRQ